MTQEDKELLIKDLSARVPYGVKADITGEKETPCEICSIDMDFKMVKYYIHKTKGFTLTKSEYIVHNDVLTIKPYLRPISALTDEEMDKMFDILHIDKTGEGEDWIKINDVTGIKLFLPSGKWIEDITELYDYLYSIHIDFRGLISNGLAIEVTEDNNPYK